MLTIADFFSGAGGLSLGFKRARFRAVIAIDNDPFACETYKANIGPHAYRSKIEDVDVETRGSKLEWLIGGQKIVTPPIDVLVGGLPCQGFSQLNRAAKDGDDPRNSLWKHYYRLLRILKPKVLLIENVPQLLKSQEFKDMKRRFIRLGYNVRTEVLNAEEFGVPQRRKRAFILGILDGTPKFPMPSRLRRTVRAAFRGLPLTPNGINLHVARQPTPLSVQRYMAIPYGGNRFDLPLELQPPCWQNKRTGSTDVFGRMWYERAAPTIRTEFLKPEKGRYLHPKADRPITLREGARLQTFPDSFRFHGSYTQVAKQIGNAVPCKLAFELAQHIRSTYFTRR